MKELPQPFTIEQYEESRLQCPECDPFGDSNICVCESDEYYAKELERLKDNSPA